MFAFAEESGSDLLSMAVVASFGFLNGYCATRSTQSALKRVNTLGPLWATMGHYNLFLNLFDLFDRFGCICSSFEASLCLIVINEIPTLSSEQRKTCGRISVPQMRVVQLH